MRHYDIHDTHDFFEYVRVEDGSVPEGRSDRIDVGLLDMNHHYVNIGHDALVHAVVEAAEPLREQLLAAHAKVRVISFDVRRRSHLPASDRFPIYIGTGGPGHLDPRLNDGVSEWCQGVTETADWEAPLFHLFDDILSSEDTALLAVCHSFGLVCRWSGIAEPVLREEKSTGLRLNRLSREAMKHPWFARFARELPDHQHFHVVDNRLFDLILTDTRRTMPIAFEAAGSSALTMVELARDPSGEMPRFLAFNHHPELVDREHALEVIDEKREHHEVTDEWYQERYATIMTLFGEQERQSRLTSHYTLLEPLRFHLARIVSARG